MFALAVFTARCAIFCPWPISAKARTSAEMLRPLGGSNLIEAPVFSVLRPSNAVLNR